MLFIHYPSTLHYPFPMNFLIKPLLSVFLVSLAYGQSVASFKNPPESSKPGVYWYFMDGNLSREGMTKDLESMKAVGINNLIFLEIGAGVPRGSIDFMSDAWQDLYLHAVREAERLGIQIRLGAGPGWTGSGGPWVKGSQSMKHLVFSETQVSGNQKVSLKLPIPKQRSTPWHKMKNPYYQDISIYAIPSNVKPLVKDINEKAFYKRDPYTSKRGVKPHLPALADYKEPPADKILNSKAVIDLKDNLSKEGVLTWEVPEGDWTVVRMGARSTGAGTRPAPKPVIGLECDKMNAEAFADHLKHYTDILLKKTAPRKKGVGWIGFHMDSWESGTQNWTDDFVDAFKRKRGYDPEPYFLAYTGRVVQSLAITERFLWDVRQTCKELMIERHAQFGKDYAHKHGLELTIEPYDMNPIGDLDLGSVADVIMAEFWSKRFGFDSTFAVMQATSIAHIKGQPMVAAEVFTSNPGEVWQQYPWSMKDQSDWALSHGVNRFLFHTFAHKPLGDQHRPGMTMAIWGVHWDRGQTWWPMVKAYHEYISRCSHMLQQGESVADILYLTPEGAPMVFTPPQDALEYDKSIYKNRSIPDKKGYSFDACSPNMLLDAQVRDGKLYFSGGSSYSILVLPNFDTMRPMLLEKITQLVADGATIIGNPPLKSPSLSGYPDCDNTVKAKSKKLWGSLKAPVETEKVKYGKGIIYCGLQNDLSDKKTLYPSYQKTSVILSQMGISEDFKSKNKKIRFGHRRTAQKDIYFVANRTNKKQTTVCSFRALGKPELWHGVEGSTRPIHQYQSKGEITQMELSFHPYESYFIVFNRNASHTQKASGQKPNFPDWNTVTTLEGPWEVSFDPQWGGPSTIEFAELQDWTKHQDRGIKYYSGIATYRKTFQVKEKTQEEYCINLGVVNDIAKVYLNGKEIGVVWCAPWQIDISDALQVGENTLEVEVANRWVNRLLGDRQKEDANVRTVQFPNGMMGGKKYRTGRYTFTPKAAMHKFNFKEPLSSGLLGPVSIKRKQW